MLCLRCDATLASVLYLANVMPCLLCCITSDCGVGPLGLTVSHIIMVPNVNLAERIDICLYRKRPVLHLFPTAMITTVWNSTHHTSLIRSGSKTFRAHFEKILNIITDRAR